MKLYYTTSRFLKHGGKGFDADHHHDGVRRPDGWYRRKHCERRAAIHSGLLRDRHQRRVVGHHQLLPHAGRTAPAVRQDRRRRPYTQGLPLGVRRIHHRVPGLRPVTYLDGACRIEDPAGYRSRCAGGRRPDDLRQTASRQASGQVAGNNDRRGRPGFRHRPRPRRPAGRSAFVALDIPHQHPPGNSCYSHRARRPPQGGEDVLLRGQEGDGPAVPGDSVRGVRHRAHVICRGEDRMHPGGRRGDRHARPVRRGEPSRLRPPAGRQGVQDPRPGPDPDLLHGHQPGLHGCAVHPPVLHGDRARPELAGLRWHTAAAIADLAVPEHPGGELHGPPRTSPVRRHRVLPGHSVHGDAVRHRSRHGHRTDDRGVRRDRPDVGALRGGVVRTHSGQPARGAEGHRVVPDELHRLHRQHDRHRPLRIPANHRQRFRRRRTPRRSAHPAHPCP